MSKSDADAIEGVVEEALKGAFFNVRLEFKGRERITRCYLSGKMYKNRIRVLIGDKVKVVMTPDGSLGRIIRRI